MKDLRLLKLTKKVSLKGSGTSYNKKNVAKDNPSQTREKLVFMTSSALCEKFTSIFQDIASINKNFIEAGKLGTMLSF